MKQLITITEQNGNKAVSARELHAFLEVKSDFNNWIKNRINEYGFIENQDFEVFVKNYENSNGGRPLKEYIISLDMAKELSMVEKTEKGKQARRYFIDMEKKVKRMPVISKVSDEQAYLDLVTLIKKYLQRGDIRDVSKATGLSEKTLGLVSKGMKAKPQFLQSLYQRALENKKTGKILNYTEMINNLK